MFLATQVLPVCVSCSHCLFLIVTVLCLLTSWACWPTLGKVDKGSKHWTKQSPAFSLCSFSLSLSLTLSPPSFLIDCLLCPPPLPSLSLEVCPSTSGEAELLTDSGSPFTPPSPSLFSRSLSFSLAQSLCMCACCCGSQIAHWGDAGSWLWSELREGHQRGPTIRLIKDTMAASFSTSSPPPHHSFLFWSEFQSLFLKLDCWSDSLITKSFRGDPCSHPLHRPRCSSSTCVSVGEEFTGFGMTEILVSDVNLNSVCERLEQHCCVDQNQHNLSSQPQTPVHKRHSNTGAKLWGRVRSKLLRQKVSG